MKIRHQFVLMALEPDANISELCREHGISRKTAYKWLERFKARGVQGLEDLSKRPHSSPLRASGEMVLQVLEQRALHPRWGPKKLHKVLSRGQEDAPSVRTIARILDRAGEARKRRRAVKCDRPTDAPSPNVEDANDLWTVDFKGWWNSKDGAKCEPLTVRDAYSRFVLGAQLLDNSSAETVRSAFEGFFDAYGLPRAILVDNGPPFASTRARHGTTTLSAWWVALGIRVHRSRPGHPQDNGGHERMHLDMRYEVEDVGAKSKTAQQAKLDEWRQEFNHVRPHEALEMRTPGDIYRRSPRLYRRTRNARYPSSFVVRKVQSSGRVRYRGQLLKVGSGFRGYQVGIETIASDSVRIHFYELDLGTFELAA
ncbi:MAG: IS481 family transposase [Nannocystales bacterium]